VVDCAKGARGARFSAQAVGFGAVLLIPVVTGVASYFALGKFAELSATPHRIGAQPAADGEPESNKSARPRRRRGVLEIAAEDFSELAGVSQGIF